MILKRKRIFHEKKSKIDHNRWYSSIGTYFSRSLLNVTELHGYCYSHIRDRNQNIFSCSSRTYPGYS